jgi:hypothetical protein
LRENKPFNPNQSFVNTQLDEIAVETERIVRVAEKGVRVFAFMEGFALKFKPVKTVKGGKS